MILLHHEPCRRHQQRWRRSLVHHSSNRIIPSWHIFSRVASVATRWLTEETRVHHHAHRSDDSSVGSSLPSRLLLSLRWRHPASCPRRHFLPFPCYILLIFICRGGGNCKDSRGTSLAVSFSVRAQRRVAVVRIQFIMFTQQKKKRRISWHWWWNRISLCPLLSRGE